MREFDAATRDRLKILEVEPSYAAWKPYALSRGVSRCVLSYLDIRQEEFYRVETTVDGLTVVTPRAWEDLSEMIQFHEELGLTVDEALTGQYLQNKETARDFALYYALYQRYRQTYRVDELLAGVWTDATLTQAREARLDERMSLISLLLEGVFRVMGQCTVRHDALALAAATLKAQRAALSVPGEPLAALAQLEDVWRAQAKEAPAGRQSAYLDLMTLSESWRGELAGETPFAALRTSYSAAVRALQQDVADVQQKIGNLLRFLEQAFGHGTELSVAVNDLTVAPEAAAFLGQFLSKDYFEASRGLLLHRQEEALLHAIDLTGTV